jgi:uncharacterized membrane protein
MPFCSHCGNPVDERDVFCGRCGSRQPVGATVAADPLSGLTPRTAAILCYIPFLGWIPAIVVLAADKFRNNRTVRFHAFQGLYLFVAMLLEDWVLRPFFRTVPGFHLDDLVKLALVGISIFMMIKAANEEPYSLPILGELAERSLAER